MKKISILFIMLAASFFINAEIREITNGSRVWETTDCKKFKPLFSLTLERPDLGTTLVKELATESIDTYNKFYLLYAATGDYGFDYHFYICNYLENTNTLLYTIKAKDQDRDIKSAYYSGEYVYCLEIPKDENAKYYITKRTIQSIEIIDEYKIDMFCLAKQAYHIWSMYVDEKNDRLLFIISNNVNNLQQQFLKIFSLTTGKEEFSSATDFRSINLDEGKVYLSKQNKLYTLNIVNGVSFSPVEIESFVPKKEKIVHIWKNNDIYVLTTEYEKFNFIMNFLFGTNSHIYTNYACKFQNGKLVKIQKLKMPKKEIR